MSHILCPTLAPAAIDSLLYDLQHSSSELATFIEVITADVNVADFGASFLEQTPSMCSCEAITVLVQCRIVDEAVRESFLQTERPQEDFEPEDLESWNAILLALQFASQALIIRITQQIPIELIAAALAVLPTETQEKGRKIFYQ